MRTFVRLLMPLVASAGASCCMARVLRGAATDVVCNGAWARAASRAKRVADASRVSPNAADVLPNQRTSTNPRHRRIVPSYTRLASIAGFKFVGDPERVALRESVLELQTY